MQVAYVKITKIGSTTIPFSTDSSRYRRLQWQLQVGLSGDGNQHRQLQDDSIPLEITILDDGSGSGEVATSAVTNASRTDVTSLSKDEIMQRVNAIDQNTMQQTIREKVMPFEWLCARCRAGL